MFGIGPMEAIIIALVAVIFVGPDKLPGVLKKFGRFYVQAKRHANDVKSGFDQAIHEAERDLELDRIRELQKQIQEATSLSNVIDADHSDKTKQLASSDDDIHTEDGRLKEQVNAQDKAEKDSGMMPPDELEETQKAVYHEGHLPPQNRDEDHDPFASDKLQNPALAKEESPKKESSETIIKKV